MSYQVSRRGSYWSCDVNNLSYKAYPTMAKFHADYLKYRMRFVAGPPGSGKSVGSVCELLSIALRQEPAPDGVRYTKFLIIRSTYGELETTTLKTLQAWLPDRYTTVTYSMPIVVTCRFPLSDGTVADISFELLAIKTDQDLKKLDSYEVTAAWLNEVIGLPPAVVAKALERSGRYPPPNLWNDGKNHCTWYGVICDYNYPPKDHWIVEYLHEGELPLNTMLYEQPPALLEEEDPQTGKISYRINPEAENLVNMDNGQKYLSDLDNYQSLGLHDLIQTRLLCRYGRAGGTGKPVFNNFDSEFHIAEEELEPMLYTNTIVSMDTSGIHPCALFWQYVRGKWRITDGMYGEEMGLEEFIEDVLTPIITSRYAGCELLFVCDPANARDSFKAITPTDLLKQCGYKAITAVTNRLKERITAGEILLNKREKGSLLISPKIGMLIDALSGAYQFRKLRVSGVITMYSSQPEKNEYSHWADAFQYGALHLISNTLSDEEMRMAQLLAKSSIKRGQRGMRR